MELRLSALVIAFFAVVLVAKCSVTEAHSLHRRAAEDDVNYDDTQADEANDDYAQNDPGVEPEKPEAPAVIVTKPTTYEPIRGKDLRLECIVDPDKGTVVQWYKGDVLYFFSNMKMNMEATRFSIVNGSKDLQIKEVTPEDSGTYRCEVVRKVHPLNVTHNVVVLEPPKIIRLSATNKGSVVEGSDVLLTCDVSGVPAPQIIWSREVENGNQRLQEKDGEFSTNTVYIRNIGREKSGKYYCYALNSVGHNQSEIEITVAGKPRVHVHRAKVNSAVKIEAVLQCTAHEERNPHMRWYKDGRLIEDSSSQYTVTTRGVHSNLTVIPASDQDFGTFTCEAENMHGKHNKSIELTQSPIVEDFEVEGSKLSWTVHSHLPLEEMEVLIRSLDTNGEWMRLAVPLPEKTGHVYDITYDLSDKQLEPAKYEAIVKVKNTNSWAGSNDPLNVEIEPRAQLIQTASVIGGGSSGHSTRPSYMILLSFFMYLLVRMS